MYVIRITHCKRELSAGQYAQMILRVKAAAPGTQFKESLCGWWPATREEILKQFYQMVTDKINEAAPPRGLTANRLSCKMRAKLKSKCRWCGMSLGRYEDRERRFCSADCRRDFNS